MSLEGSYGTTDNWEIKHSTHPWREGARLLSPEIDVVLLVKGRRVELSVECAFRASSGKYWSAHFTLQELTEPGGLLAEQEETTHDKARL